MAGRLGVDPFGFTWRQLDEMDWARRIETWEQTSFIMAAATNAQRKRADCVKLDQFNVYKRAKARAERRAEPYEIEPHMRYI